MADCRDPVAASRVCCRSGRGRAPTTSFDPARTARERRSTASSTGAVPVSPVDDDVVANWSTFCGGAVKMEMWSSLVRTSSSKNLPSRSGWSFPTWNEPAIGAPSVGAVDGSTAPIVQSSEADTVDRVETDGGDGRPRRPSQLSFPASNSSGTSPISVARLPGGDSTSRR